MRAALMAYTFQLLKDHGCPRDQAYEISGWFNGETVEDAILFAEMMCPRLTGIEKHWREEFMAVA
jgi:hypothetical protein